MDSLEAASRFDDASLDFVFIDAAHEKDAVLADIKAWLPKVKKGGVIAGHDYYPENPEYCGVAAAVHEFFKNEAIISQENCWIKEVQ